jgi:hypothetical protein
MEMPFRVEDRVRLLAHGLPVPAGSEGVVAGFYVRDPVVCVVLFDGKAVEVEAQQLVALAEPPESE